MPDAPLTSVKLEEILNQGILAARSGRRERARELLLQVIRQDEGQSAAWFHLSTVIDNPEEQQICLENVLALDPENYAAQKALEQLRARQANPPEQAAPATATEAVATAPVAAPPPTAVEGPIPPATTEPQPAGQPGDEYLCPFCLAPTRPEERQCRSCGASLWARSREQDEHSPRLKFVLTLQAVCVGATAGALILLFYYVILKLKMGDLPTLLQLYFGNAAGADPEVAAAYFSVLPRSSVYLITFVALFSLLVLAGLTVRWKGAFYLVLVNGGGLLMVGIIVTSVLWGAVDWGGEVITLVSRLALIAVDVILVVVVLAMALEVRDDFFFEKERLLFRLDREPITTTDFLVHARRYGQRQVWGLAALHYHEALKRGADVEAALGLAASYIRLRRPALASQALEQARHLKAGDPRIEELARLVENGTSR